MDLIARRPALSYADERPAAWRITRIWRIRTAIAMRSIKSPWQTTFDEFAASIRKSALIAAPYITRRPIERLAVFKP